MKKILSLLTAIGLTATASITVISCNSINPKDIVIVNNVLNKINNLSVGVAELKTGDKTFKKL